MNRISYDSLPEEVQALKDRIAKLEKIVAELSNNNEEFPYKDAVETARLMNKTPNAIRIIAFNKAIPTIKRGKKLYFHIDDIKNYMEGGRRGKIIQVLK